MQALAPAPLVKRDELELVELTEKGNQSNASASF
jgi:hypothetical protein